MFHIFGSLAEFERAIIRERTHTGLDAARGRRGGRPSMLSDKDLTAAKALLNDPNITVEKVAQCLKVATSTRYRHLPGGRSAIGEN